MSQQKDLTRWNRAGKTRFRYVDGNAVEYLETLRQQLAKRFSDSETERCEWIIPAEEIPENEIKQDNESLIQQQERLSRKQKRILEMYHQDRRDWAWEISRTFARACHILTEYADAYANENFLGTATQWDHVRQLVAMLDYHPAPPASASTHLAIIARQNKAGIVGKGFQVKNSPAEGGTKVIFETLDDLFIDSALNELRAKGWNQSEDPALPNQDETLPQPDEEPPLSPIAYEPAINLQGVGPISANKLNSLVDTGCFKIKDFLNPALDISVLDVDDVWCQEWKAKASIVIHFLAEGGGAALSEWLLSEIAQSSEQTLVDLTGKSLQSIEDFKQDIGVLAICLDAPVFATTRLKELYVSVDLEEKVATGIESSWRAKAKPKVVVDDIGIIYREYIDELTGEYIDEAQATIVDKVDKQTDHIHLKPNLFPNQNSWFEWKKSEARLKLSPRWKRKCNLNGENVIHTVEAHGLREGAFIGWQQNNLWKFAEVVEADEMNLRLKVMGRLPEPGVLLLEAQTLETGIMASSMLAIGLAGGDEPAIEEVPLASLTETDPVFTMKDVVPNDPQAPEFMPPGSLSFGSFLFPTPMLPMALVKFAVDLMLCLGVMVIPSTGKAVFKSPCLSGKPELGKLYSELKDKVDWRQDLDTESKRIDALAEMLQTPDEQPSVLFQKILNNLEEKGPLIAVNKSPVIKAVVAPAPTQYIFNGSPGKIENGNWVVAQFKQGVRALKIIAINEFTEGDKKATFALSFENFPSNEGVLKVFADFRNEIIAEGAAFNNSSIDSDEIELETVPDSLKVGREILLNGDGKNAVLAKIKSIEGNTIKTDPPASGFSKGELVIHGNVVAAGHGISRPVKILGSGNAVKSNQEFILEVEAVSFIPDPAKSSGVAAAIEVDVAGQIWQQVSTLKDSFHGDHHYAIRMTEQGYVKILFGDGENGRRLPTGKNNIRVRFRVGSGLAGNISKHGLEKPVSSHSLIGAVSQPVAATGGGDMEDITSLRENAPPNILALKRAVSLSDFSHLAASQSSVWQAKAYRQIPHGGRMEQVKVIIVPAGGVKSTSTDEAVRTFLQQHALPGIMIDMENYDPDLFDLSVTVRIKINEFVSEEVEKAVISALTGHFTLQNRRLGENLYLSEIYKIVEGVKGVENSICILNGNKNLQVIEATDENTIVFMDINANTNPSTLNVDVEEYLP